MMFIQVCLLFVLLISDIHPKSVEDIDDALDNPCDCDTSPCPPNSTCSVNKDGSVNCCCDPGWTGDNCDKLVDACTINPCKHEGECSVDNGQAVCTCKEGFGGEFCDTDCSVAPRNCPAPLQETGGNCYHICTEGSESWLKARETCMSLNAVLWEPNSDDEVGYVIEELDTSAKYWTGINDRLNEGDAVFDGSGDPFTPGDVTVDTTTQVKDCVEILRDDGRWKLEYRTCTVTKRRCICEMKNPCPPMYG